MVYILIEMKIKEDDFIVIEDELYINFFDRWEFGEEKDDVIGILFLDGMNEEGEVDFKFFFD